MTIPEIIALAANHYGVPADRIKRRCRLEVMRRARGLAVRMIRETADLDFSSIAEIFDCDRGTVGRDAAARLAASIDAFERKAWEELRGK